MSPACTVPGQNETSLTVVAHQLCLSLSEHLIVWAQIRDSWGMGNKWCWGKHVRDFIRAGKWGDACLFKLFPSLDESRWTDSIWSVEYITPAEIQLFHTWDTMKTLANNLQCHAYCTIAWFKFKDYSEVFVQFPNHGTNLPSEKWEENYIDARLLQTNTN